jgi:hypothetical protein
LKKKNRRRPVRAKRRNQFQPMGDTMLRNLAKSKAETAITNSGGGGHVEHDTSITS